VAWLELLESPLLTELLVLPLVLESALLDELSEDELVVPLGAVLLVPLVLVPDVPLSVEVTVLSCDDEPEPSSEEAKPTPVSAATPSEAVSAPATMPVRMRRLRRRAWVRSMGPPGW
jgi:hypothetical protein